MLDWLNKIIKMRMGVAKKRNLELDFIVNKGMKRYCIQSTLDVDDIEKRNTEIKPFLYTYDSFKKIIIIKDNIIPKIDDKSYVYISIERLLLDKKSLDI